MCIRDRWYQRRVHGRVTAFFPLAGLGLEPSSSETQFVIKSVASNPAVDELLMLVKEKNTTNFYFVVTNVVKRTSRVYPVTSILDDFKLEVLGRDRIAVFLENVYGGVDESGDSSDTLSYVFVRRGDEFFPTRLDFSHFNIGDYSDILSMRYSPVQKRYLVIYKNQIALYLARFGEQGAFEGQVSLVGSLSDAYRTFPFFAGGDYYLAALNSGKPLREKGFSYATSVNPEVKMTVHDMRSGEKVDYERTLFHQLYFKLPKRRPEGRKFVGFIKKHSDDRQLMLRTYTFQAAQERMQEKWEAKDEWCGKFAAAVIRRLL
eukprot:TRINITY_DN4994_c0_g1_i3.p1 TRINITY_DN4994_c0_g1~~TRINITY_DN4994_c0_g1_i3.p1  ORF type:complete len:338 (+),score=74.44 TRINITY_DN4994_c0_g1_i3:63-1016(+)